MSPPGWVTLPSGRSLDLYRSRWEGVLDREELEYCRQHGIQLGYDCAQIGWVTMTCIDELSGVVTSPGWPNEEIRDATADPEEAVVALCASVRADAERVLEAVREGRVSPDHAAQQLASAAATALAPFAEEHDVYTSDFCHWALESVVAEALVGSLGQRSPSPPATDPMGFAFRAWTADDAAVYVELLGNRNVWQYLPDPFPSPFTEDTARTLIEVASLRLDQDASAIELDGRPIGQCLLRLDRSFANIRAAEIAYWLGEDYWGQGWMSRILPAFTQRCFRHHPVDVIYAWIKPGNEASVRVAARAGYRRDSFPHESQLAEVRGRAGFARYSTYRADWPMAPSPAD